MTRPLVTAITLTIPERKPFLDALGKQIANFSMTPDEWLIEEGPETIGEKRQRALERAKGDIIVLLDDDDWHHPDRLEKQVKMLTHSPVGAPRGWGLVATRRFFVHDMRTGRTVRSRLWDARHGSPPAGSMAFWRDLALKVGFRPGLGAEKLFCDVWEQKTFGHFEHQKGLFDMKDPSLYVLVRHGKNASPDSWCWTEHDATDEELHQVLGDSWFSRP